MKKVLAKIWFFIMGWKLVAPKEVIAKSKKSVMIAAPHTTNWDFPFAIFGFWLMGLDLKYFIKDTYTKGILGGLFRWTGALGVDRNKRNNLVAHAIDLLQSTEQLVILVPAEGTRKKVEVWKTGFYKIATGANVPVSLGYLDYKNKIAGVGKVVDLTGNFEKDMLLIENFYREITGKHPENYNPEIFKRNDK